jgi:catechol 2,3-dioxygenase-like lactoylglutathione lyase family enzyme
MFNPNFLLLYVADPLKSAAFYADILGQKPAETAPTFAMFALSSGLKLGLWVKEGVQPPAPAHNGGSELCIAVESADRVRATHAAWAERGLPILQAPTEMDFGHTFVAADPDGHRLRVFAPRAA